MTKRIVRLIFVSIVLFVSFMMLAPLKGDAETFSGEKKLNEVFADPVFAQAMANELGKSVTSNIYQSDLDKVVRDHNNVYGEDTLIVGIEIDKINKIYTPVQNLEGIQYLNKVQSFAIYGNGLTTSSIAQLGNINSNAIVRRVQFYGSNNLSDISIFSKSQFNQLWEILLAGNKNITSLNGLQNSPELKLLKIQDCGVTDISAINGFTGLWEIYGKGNNVSDISALSKANELRILFLEDNHNLADLSPLKDKTELHQISFMNDNISDISPLSTSKKLTSIFLRNNKILDVSPLKDIRNVTELLLSQNKIADISPLKDVTYTGGTLNKSFASQVVEGDPVMFSRLEPLKLNITNIIKSVSNDVIDPISYAINPPDVNTGFDANNASFSTPIVTWQLNSDATTIAYKWSTNTDLPGNQWNPFSGTITIPLVEKPLTNLVIKNSIINTPIKDQNMTYILKVISDDGATPIYTDKLKEYMDATYKDKLSTYSGNAYMSTFTLKSDEQLILPTIVNGKYEIQQIFDSDTISSKYTKTSDSVNITADYHLNDWATEQLTTSNNKINFENIYKSGPLIVTNKDISSVPLQSDFEYKLLFTINNANTKFQIKGVKKLNGVVTQEVSFPLDNQNHSIMINHNETLELTQVPVGVNTTIVQNDYPYYVTNFSVDGGVKTTGTSPPVQVLTEVGKTVAFENKATYKPPITAVPKDNFTLTILLTGILASSLSIGFYLIKRRNKKKEN